MCGIVGYVGRRDAVRIVVEGLRRLEYRGYDSAGIAVATGGELCRRRAEGKLHNLERVLADDPLHGHSAVGHTRWATHGRPSEENAHPHVDRSGNLVVVHNGIIENYLQLKARLTAEGHAFETQTDTEVVAHLVGARYVDSLERAAREALAEVQGVYALLLMHRGEPQTLVAARRGPPMVIGLGEGERFVASDVPALLPHTRDVIFLEDGDVAVVSPDSVRVTDQAGANVERTAQRITWDPVQVEKGGYRHFMLKEIHEQPRAVRDTLLGRVGLDEGIVYLEELGAATARLRGVERVVLLACGTSWHAALIGEFFLETLAGLPAEVDYGSEFRYRQAPLGPGTLALAISQSGETADTLASFRDARDHGAVPLGICNVEGSGLTREAEGVLLTHAGPEIGVASTKAFSSQVLAIGLLALYLGRLRGRLSAEACRVHLDALTRVPHQMEAALQLEAAVVELAARLGRNRDFLFMGRGVNYPIALEGALKLKEISYLHAEGYPAGEMKHGPIALIDDELPVVALCPRGHVYDKMLSNVQEVKARGGRVIAIASEGDPGLDAILEDGDCRLEVPALPELWSPLLTIIPLQLLAYHIALRAGRDVDQPRNLAKSVTVE